MELEEVLKVKIKIKINNEMNVRSFKMLTGIIILMATVRNTQLWWNNGPEQNK